MWKGRKNMQVQRAKTSSKNRFERSSIERWKFSLKNYFLFPCGKAKHCLLFMELIARNKKILSLWKENDFLFIIHASAQMLPLFCIRLPWGPIYLCVWYNQICSSKAFQVNRKKEKLGGMYAIFSCILRYINSTADMKLVYNVQL